jgi:hypothetical protein
LKTSGGTSDLVPISLRWIREVWGAKEKQVMRDGIYQRIWIEFWYPTTNLSLRLSELEWERFCLEEKSAVELENESTLSDVDFNFVMYCNVSFSFLRIRGRAQLVCLHLKVWYLLKIPPHSTCL